MMGPQSQRRRTEGRLEGEEWEALPVAEPESEDSDLAQTVLGVSERWVFWNAIIVDIYFDSSLGQN